MLKILFEDDRILAVLKKSGMPSQSHSADEIGTCESEIREQFPNQDFQLLHRLDTGTSGVLLFSKNSITYEEMREKFKLKTIRKIYWAWALKDPSKLTALSPNQCPFHITLPLAHHPKSKKRMIPLPPGVKRQYRGKPLPAETIIHEMKTDQFEGVPCQKLEVEILTGVMHQIRVHLAHHGFPLIGDPIYGADPKPETRLGLHAVRVEFNLGGQSYLIEAPFP
jgi:23S rRNA-/tRNA-specific pseudouridylate synthase